MSSAPPGRSSSSSERSRSRLLLSTKGEAAERTKTVQVCVSGSENRVSLARPRAGERGVQPGTDGSGPCRVRAPAASAGGRPSHRRWADGFECPGSSKRGGSADIGNCAGKLSDPHLDAVCHGVESGRMAVQRGDEGRGRPHLLLLPYSQPSSRLVSDDGLPRTAVPQLAPRLQLGLPRQPPAAAPVSGPAPTAGRVRALAARGHPLFLREL